MKWIRLSELKGNAFSHGTLFRCAATWPYEDVIEFMLSDSNISEFHHMLIVSSGFKSGLILRYLPTESKAIGNNGLSADWLAKNWRKHIYLGTAKNVFVCPKGRPKPKLPNV
jgi:hypothetical protein